uniref:Uncharacterized protein n=1 Tax=Euplotes crassus TaxID=5936 RepID=A0A7S3KAE8_EUPCR|mmetsp:Transcript_17842/g.17566  ORF Transcript_17842/g.17566 Transcript_17842/m.17566 type:complete len:113 (+) Transcript_17842:500-838(+)
MIIKATRIIGKIQAFLKTKVKKPKDLLRIMIRQEIISISRRGTNKNHKNSNNFEEEKSSKVGEKTSHQRPPNTKSNNKNTDDSGNNKPKSKNNDKSNTKAHEGKQKADKQNK